MEIKPLVTEKSVKEASIPRYTFLVSLGATKNQIAQVLADLYGVSPIKIQTVTLPGKTRRVGRRAVKVSLPATKKAIVTLKKGQKLDFFETPAQDSPKEGK